MGNGWTLKLRSRQFPFLLAGAPALHTVGLLYINSVGSARSCE